MLRSQIMYKNTDGEDFPDFHSLYEWDIMNMMQGIKETCYNPNLATNPSLYFYQHVTMAPFQG